MPPTTEHQWQPANRPAAVFVKAACGRPAEIICPRCGHTICQEHDPCPDCAGLLSAPCQPLNPPSCDQCETEITFEQSVAVEDPAMQTCGRCALALALSGTIDLDARMDLSAGELVRIIATVAEAAQTPVGK